MRPTVLVVYCHSNPHSYTRAVLDAVLAGLATQPCDVELVDLYADGFDPVLIVDAAHRRRDLDKVEATARYRAQLAACAAVVFVYPLWWGGFPAMLKGYLDRTFVSGLTYSFAGRGPRAVFPAGLMRGKPAYFFYTLDSPRIVAWLDPGWFGAYVSVFRYCGFGPVRRYYLARLKLTSPATRARWLTKVRDRAAALGGRLARRHAR
jgi:NAD(P)H dehydrogenase (quinone)